MLRSTTPDLIDCEYLDFADLNEDEQIALLMSAPDLNDRNLIGGNEHLNLPDKVRTTDIEDIIYYLLLLFIFT